MKKTNSSRLATIAQYLVLSLLLSQSTTTNTNTVNALWSFGGTSLACAVGLTAFVLAFKKPEKDIPTLRKQATFIEQVLYQLDQIIGQKKRTKFYEDENGNLRITKIPSRGLGTLYETFTQALPWIAIFQTIGKARDSLKDFTKHTGIDNIWSENKDVVASKA